MCTVRSPCIRHEITHIIYVGNVTEVVLFLDKFNNIITVNASMCTWLSVKCFRVKNEITFCGGNMVRRRDDQSIKVAM